MFKSTLIKATHAGAEVLKKYFNGVFDISSKDTLNNLVTEVDTKAEAEIIRVIREDCPDHFILSEEVGSIAQDSPYKWIIDPIDGTVNFAHGIPICCVSIGLEKDGEIIMGAVYNPFMDEFFFAEKGKGAFLNDQPIKVSLKKDLASACLVTGFPYKWTHVENGPIEVFERFIRKGLPVRRLGSAAIDLCWVACGRFDGFWEHNLNAWDTAAGYLMVKEAGGTISDFAGNNYSLYQPQLLASNGLIHSQLINVINNNK